MSALQIVCDNCGAKYRLPENFANDKAKCKACGSAIDVAGQRDAGSKPASATARAAASMPAATARPAVQRSALEPALPRTGPAGRRERGTPSGSERNGRQGRSGRRGDRGNREPQPGNSRRWLILGGIGVLVVGIVIAVLVLNSGKQPAPGTGGPAPTAGAGNEASSKPPDGKAVPADAKKSAPGGAAVKPAPGNGK